MAQMIQSICQFDSWLKKKLIELNTDDEIYCPYIRGILESDDCYEEKQEGLEGILIEIIDKSLDLDKICTEIIKEWNLYIINEESIKKGKENVVNVDEKLIELIQQTKVTKSNKTQAPVPIPMNSEQKKLKEAILAQYAEVSSGDTSDEDYNEPASKNTNVEAVLQADRDKRDKDKEDSYKKKEKDKEDKAKQRSKDEDRKEKEKKRTQKGEKRR